MLDEFAKSLEFKEMNAKAIEEMTNEFLAKKDRKLKDLAQPIRIAITGSAVSPSIFEVIEIIGIDELKSRIPKITINRARVKISSFLKIAKFTA